MKSSSAPPNLTAGAFAPRLLALRFWDCGFCVLRAGRFMGPSGSGNRDAERIPRGRSRPLAARIGRR